MGSQLPANEDISAPILIVGPAGVETSLVLLDGTVVSPATEIDKFMGMTGFTYENPSTLLETHPGTVVGVETNSTTNKITFSFMVHSSARNSLALLNKLVASGQMIHIEAAVPTDKQGIYRAGQLVKLGLTNALISGGGRNLGGKNAGAISFKAEGFGPIEVEK